MILVALLFCFFFFFAVPVAYGSTIVVSMAAVDEVDLSRFRHYHAEHQFSEQGSVSRPHFTFYCLGKVESRRSCAAKFTFLYLVPLE